MEKTTCEKKNSCFWKMVAMFMIGVVVGFMFAPIKKGVRVCCDNTNSMNAGGSNGCCDDECLECDDSENPEDSDWEDETQAYSF